MNSIFQSGKISADSKCSKTCEWNDFVIFNENILSFWSYLWIEYMDECPFKFDFKSGFNLPAKVFAYNNEK